MQFDDLARLSTSDPMNSPETIFLRNKLFQYHIIWLTAIKNNLIYRYIYWSK